MKEKRKREIEVTCVFSGEEELQALLTNAFLLYVRCAIAQEGTHDEPLLV